MEQSQIGEVAASRVRKPRRMDGPQQITRIPEYRPGDWVKISSNRTGAEQLAEDLAGKVRRIQSLTCTLSRHDEHRARWRCIFDDGRCVPVQAIARRATDAERAQGQIQAERAGWSTK